MVLFSMLELKSRNNEPWVGSGPSADGGMEFYAKVPWQQWQSQHWKVRGWGHGHINTGNALLANFRVDFHFEHPLDRLTICQKH